MNRFASTTSEAPRPRRGAPRRAGTADARMGREPAKEPERAASLAFETRAGAIAPAAEEATANMATASTGGAWRASKCARPSRAARRRLGRFFEERHGDASTPHGTKISASVHYPPMVSTRDAKVWNWALKSPTKGRARDSPINLPINRRFFFCFLFPADLRSSNWRARRTHLAAPRGAQESEADRGRSYHRVTLGKGVSGGCTTVPWRPAR